MGKKKKRRSSNRPVHAKRSAPKPKKSAKYLYAALVVGALLIITGVYFLNQKEKPQKRSPQHTNLKKENISLRETRATLSPNMFQGKVKRAYQIAREIPEVLDRLYCYCRCRENFGHKNLLSCYVGTHAST